MQSDIQLVCVTEQTFAITSFFVSFVSFCGFFFFKQKTAYEIYQCDWSSDVCSSDLAGMDPRQRSNREKSDLSNCSGEEREVSYE